MTMGSNLLQEWFSSFQDEIEDQIEALILSNDLQFPETTAREVGKAHRIDDAIGRYVVFLKNTFPTI